MVTWRRKRSRLDTNKARNKRKKLVAKREQKKRVADSKRANVRTVHSTPSKPRGRSDVDSGRSHPANRNAGVLSVEGSAEAQAFNASITPPPATPLADAALAKGLALQQQTAAPVAQNTGVPASFETQTSQGVPASFETNQTPFRDPRNTAQKITEVSGEILGYYYRDANGQLQLAPDTSEGIIFESQLPATGLFKTGTKVLMTNLRTLARGKGGGGLMNKRIGLLPPKPKTSGQNIVSNTVTKKQTSQWLKKVGIAAGVSLWAISQMKDIIGTYPFSGFIGGEEALQTSDFGYRTALATGNETLIQQNLDMRSEILNKQFTDGIWSGVPYKNEAEALLTYFETSAHKLEGDKQLFAKNREKILSGKSDADIYAETKELEREWELESRAYYEQLRVDEAAQEELDRKYFRDQQDRKDFNAAEIRREEARIEKERREYYEALAEQRRAEDKANREFWEAYRKAQVKQQQDSAPSKLNFGLI